ncbi:MAG: DUF86 domain-containing protein [Coriobacteriia bacterium]|nr:DUF86 domain-containing protein [Coriobacteriia bacterium]
MVFSRGISDEALVAESTTTRGAVLYQFMILGEAANNVPDGWKERYPDVDWSRIVGMRNVVAHYYFGLADQMVIDTVRTDVPVLLPRLNEMLAAIDQEYPRL